MGSDRTHGARFTDTTMDDWERWSISFVHLTGRREIIALQSGCYHRMLIGRLLRLQCLHTCISVVRCVILGSKGDSISACWRVDHRDFNIRMRVSQWHIISFWGGIISQWEFDPRDITIPMFASQRVKVVYWSRRRMVSAHINRSTGEVLVFWSMHLNGRT
jgi:hypothetical protein